MIVLYDDLYSTLFRSRGKRALRVNLSANFRTGFSNIRGGGLATGYQGGFGEYVGYGGQPGGFGGYGGGYQRRQRFGRSVETY